MIRSIFTGLAASLVILTAPPFETTDDSSGSVFERLRLSEKRAATTAVAVDVVGEFAYDTFDLTDPPRFVLDLVGTSGEPETLIVGTAQVLRVRAAQYRPEPDPVVRLVFDLSSSQSPTVETAETGLLVRFPPGPLSANGEPPVASSPPAVDKTQAFETSGTLAELDAPLPLIEVGTGVSVTPPLTPIPETSPSDPSNRPAATLVAVKAPLPLAENEVTDRADRTEATTAAPALSSTPEPSPTPVPSPERPPSDRSASEGVPPPAGSLAEAEPEHEAPPPPAASAASSVSTPAVDPPRDQTKTQPAAWLVLKDGQRLALKEPWRLDGRRIVFTTKSGIFSSIRTGEVDIAASSTQLVDASGR